MLDKMKRLFAALIVFFSLLPFLVPASVFAHAVGQPPFLVINGKYAGYYSVPVSSQFMNIPQDGSPDIYYAGEELNFKIDKTALQVPIDIANNTVFSWDFGDGTKTLGTENTHTYKKAGSYELDITATYQSEDPQLIESALIQVLPDKSYPAPQAVIRINGTAIDDSKNDTFVADLSKAVAFDASTSSSQSPITGYIWDFGDNTSADGAKTTHAYDDNTQVTFAVLRVKNSLGLYSDTYVKIENKKFVDAGTITAPTPQPTAVNSLPNAQGSSKTTLAGSSIIDKFNYQLNISAKDFINRLSAKNASFSLIFLVFGLVFIAGSFHALTPGHGKSIMTAFLISKKGSRILDIGILAFTITATHTILIFTLGLTFLYIDTKHSIGNVIPFFEKGSAVLVILISLNLVKNAISNFLHIRKHKNFQEHTHGVEEHLHGSKRKGLKQLLIVGLAGGIIPCADAFAIMLLSASLGKIALGLILVLVFSLGLSITIILVGMLVVFGKNVIRIENRLGMLTEVYAPVLAAAFLLFVALRILL